MIRRSIVLALCACLCLALLAGCGTSKIESYDGEQTAAETEAPTTAETGTPAASAPAGNGAGAEAFAADTVVATVNGRELTWDEYYYWLSHYRSLVSSSYGAITDWAAANAYYTSNTNNEVVLGLAQSDMLYLNLLMTKAEEQGLSIPDDELTARIEADVAAILAQSDSGESAEDSGETAAEDGTLSEVDRQAFLDLLASIDMTEEMYAAITREYLTQDALYEALETATDDQAILDWANEKGYMAAKHILFITVDQSTRDETTGAYAKLSDEEVAAAKASAEDVLAQLAAAKDQAAMLALYDELMTELSEDPGKASYPDGYVFTDGEMVSAFEDGVKALDENYGLSELVESELGYHVILRLPLEPEMTLGYSSSTGEPYTLRAYALNQLFNDETQVWIDEADIVWNEGFETLDLSLVF